MKPAAMTAHDRGYAAGYSQAILREDEDARLGDSSTRFSMPSTETDGCEYERGWHCGWAEYMAVCGRL